MKLRSLPFAPLLTLLTLFPAAGASYAANRAAVAAVCRVDFRGSRTWLEPRAITVRDKEEFGFRYVLILWILLGLRYVLIHDLLYDSLLCSNAD